MTPLIIALVLVVVMLMVARLVRGQAAGSRARDDWDGASSPAFIATDGGMDTPDAGHHHGHHHGHDSSGWGDTHGGGGSWDSGSPGGDASDSSSSSND